MRHLAALLAIVACVATTWPALAADHDTGAWGIVSTTDTIDWNGQATAWRYAFDAQLRHFNRANGANQYVLRPSLGYVLANDVSLWAGYGYFLTDPDSGDSVYEHRWWQQAAWTARRWDWGTLSLRARLEERIVEDADDVGWRLRQQVQLLMPLADSDLSLNLWIEPYVNFRDTDWGARSGFDQNRAYAGVRMPMTAGTWLEAGYMHQYINRRGAEDVVNHFGILHLRFRFR